MASKRNAVIVGGGTSKFGVRAATFFDMLQEAAHGQPPAAYQKRWLL